MAGTVHYRCMFTVEDFYSWLESTWKELLRAESFLPWLLALPYALSNGTRISIAGPTWTVTSSQKSPRSHGIPKHRGSGRGEAFLGLQLLYKRLPLGRSSTLPVRRLRGLTALSDPRCQPLQGQCEARALRTIVSAQFKGGPWGLASPGR